MPTSIREYSLHHKPIGRVIWLGSCFLKQVLKLPSTSWLNGIIVKKMSPFLNFSVGGRPSNFAAFNNLIEGQDMVGSVV